MTEWRWLGSGGESINGVKSVSNLGIITHYNTYSSWRFMVHTAHMNFCGTVSYLWPRGTLPWFVREVEGNPEINLELTFVCRICFDYLNLYTSF